MPRDALGLLAPTGNEYGRAGCTADDLFPVGALELESSGGASSRMILMSPSKRRSPRLLNDQSATRQMKSRLAQASVRGIRGSRLGALCCLI